MELDFLNNAVNFDFATSIIGFLINKIFFHFASALRLNLSNFFGDNEFKSKAYR